MPFSGARNSIGWLSLALLSLAGCWRSESNTTPKPVPAPPVASRSAGVDHPVPGHQPAQAEPPPPFEIELIEPERAYQIIRLKMPYNHGGLQALASDSDSRWLAGGTRTMSMTFQGVTRSKGGDVLVWNMGDRSLRTLGSHGATVEHLLATPDGELLISISRENKTIKFWNMPEGELVEELSFPGGYWPRSTWPLVQLSEDGSLLAVVTYDQVKHEGQSYPCGGDLLIWETATHKQILHWKQTNIDAMAMAADPFRLAAIVRKQRPDDPTRSDKYLSVWNAPQQDSRQEKELRYHSSFFATLPDQDVAVRMEQPQLDKLLARYDLTTLERIGAEKLSDLERGRLSGSDFHTSPTMPGKAEYLERPNAGVIDLLTGRHLLRLQITGYTTLIDTNRFSPDLRYFVPTNDLDHVYVVQFGPE